MSKKKKTAELKFSAGILVTMTREELDSIKAVVPDGISASEWCRKVLLESVLYPFNKAK